MAPRGGVEIEMVSLALEPQTLNAVAYCLTPDSFIQVHEERAPPLATRDFKAPPVVNEMPYYIVRRLTPTECARLEGFSDTWSADLGTENPTDEEIAFWTDVFATHRRVVSGAKKPKTGKQNCWWLAESYLDSAEYRLWGNGVSLPICYFVLSGIVWAAGLDGIK